MSLLFCANDLTINQNQVRNFTMTSGQGIVPVPDLDVKSLFQSKSCGVNESSIHISEAKSNQSIQL